MRLLSDKNHQRMEADPYILKSGGRYYIYVTGHDGVHAYHSDDLLSGWQYHGMVFSYEDCQDYWAPCVIELDGKFYLYNSFGYNGVPADAGGSNQTMFVSKADHPLGPFTNARMLLRPFSIDAHVVQNEAGLFLFYSRNCMDGERLGTYIVVDKLLNPWTVAGQPVPVVEATLDEEISGVNPKFPDRPWHTVEGAFYFREGDWQYVMYSGNCFEQPTYYIGYARAKTDETDLTKIKFEKYPDKHTYHPVMEANHFEEGPGHHSLIKENGQWYMIYHARDYGYDATAEDARNARICKIYVEDGVITAEPYKDRV